MKWLAKHGADLLFWGSCVLTLGNVVQAINGPESMRDSYLITSLVCGGVVALLYIGSPDEI